MEKRREKRTVNTKSKRNPSTVKKSTTSKKIKITKVGKNKKLKPIIIVDYAFLISLVLSIIFGMQTNSAFLLPFTITLVITIVSMCIILINAIYTKIKKMFRKGENK